MRPNAVNSHLPDNLCRIAKDSSSLRHISRHQGSGLDECARADPNTFKDGRVRPDPNIVLDYDWTASDLRSLSILTERRACDRVRDALAGSERMKVGVGDCRVPADDDVTADPQFELTKKHGV